MQWKLSGWTCILWCLLQHLRQNFTNQVLFLRDFFHVLESLVFIYMGKGEMELGDFSPWHTLLCFIYFDRAVLWRMIHLKYWTFCWMPDLTLPLSAELIHFDFCMIFAHKIITGSEFKFFTICYANSTKTTLR